MKMINDDDMEDRFVINITVICNILYLKIDVLIMMEILLYIIMINVLCSLLIQIDIWLLIHLLIIN